MPVSVSLGWVGLWFGFGLGFHFTFYGYSPVARAWLLCHKQTLCGICFDFIPLFLCSEKMYEFHEKRKSISEGVALGCLDSKCSLS